MRLLLKIIGGIAILVVIALAVFINTFDINKYKPEIIAMVKEKTGRDFEIKGDLRLGYSLIPTVKVGGVSFGNAKWGSKPEMVTIGDFEARISLLPLLSGNVSVNRLVLSDTDILLETRKDGRGNWQLEAPATGKQKAREIPTTSKTGKTLGFSINEVHIKKSKLTYRDGATGKTTVASIDTLEASSKGFTQSAMTLAMKAAYNTIPIEATGEMGSLASFTSNKNYPLNLKVTVNDVVLQVDGKIDKPMQAAGLDVDVKLDAPTLDTFAKISGKKLPETGPLHVAGHVSEQGGTYAIKSLQGQAGKIKMNIDGEITPGPSIKMDMAFDLAAESLANINELSGTQLPDIKPLTLAARLSDIDDGYQLNDLKLKLGSSDLAGKASLNIKGKRPALTAAVSSNLIDLTAFTGEKKKETQQPKKTRVFSPEPLPFESLKSADMNMDIKAHQIKTSKLNMENVILALSLVNGNLKIKPLNASLAGGTLAMEMNLDASTGKTGALDTGLEIKNLEPSALPDLKDEISGGKTDISLKAKGAGNSVAAIMAGLNGSLLMKMGPGILKSSTATAASSDVFVSTYQLLYPGAKGSKDTKIQCGVVKFDIKDGIATTDKGIAFATSKMNIVGSGVVDLKTEKLDIGIDPQAREGVGISAAQLAELVRLGGTLAEPRAVPDTKAAFKAAAAGGAALATGGLSLLAEGLYDESTADEDPCATALGLKSKSSSTSVKKEEAPKSTTEKAVDTVKDTGNAIGDKVKGWFK
jgi:uncharacterized protein involved in outer membrane biogenesis